MKMIGRTPKSGTAVITVDGTDYDVTIVKRLDSTYETELTGPVDAAVTAAAIATDNAPVIVSLDSDSVMTTLPITSPTNVAPSVGAIPTINITANVIFSHDMAQYFNDDDALTYSTLSALPAGISLSNTGLLEGTATTIETLTGIVVTATDTGSLSVDSTAFDIAVASAGTYSPIGEAPVVALYTLQDIGASLVLDGADVAEWRDISGNNYHALQPDVSKRWTHNVNDSRAGGIDSVGAADGLGQKGLVLPEFEAARMYAVLTFGDGTENTFPDFSALLGNVSAMTGTIHGTTNSTVISVGGVHFSTRISKNGVDGNAVLPMPLSTFEFVGPASTESRTLGYITQRTNRNFYGAVVAVMFTDGTEDLQSSQRYTAWLAALGGVDGDLPQEYRDALTAGPPAPRPEPVELFIDSFDQHADWVGSDAVAVTNDPYIQNGTLPGWFASRNVPDWAPSTGHSDRHEGSEVLTANADKARGGTGKSAVFWREHKDGAFSNDKLLAHKVDAGADEIYAEFWIRFDPLWTESGSTKIFRIYAWDESNSPDGPFRFFTDGQSGPIFVWNYYRDAVFGLRNFVALRGGPFGENYYMSTPTGFPRSLNSGDASLHMAVDIRGQSQGGTDPQLISKLDGNYVSSLTRTVEHADIFGAPSAGMWTKFGIYLRMNSAPGVGDGVLVQWIDDHRILYNANVPWVGSTSVSISDVKWNIAGIGGNDHFESTSFDLADRHEDWFSIDDVRVLSSAPTNLSLEQ